MKIAVFRNMQLGRRVPTFRKNLLPPYSGQMKAVATCRFCRKGSNLLPDHTVSHSILSYPPFLAA
jgi:hypothetical protein